MAPCGQNYVTPTMIKKGQIEIGDRIKFEEDVLVSGPVTNAEASTVEASSPAITVAESEAIETAHTGAANYMNQETPEIQPAPAPGQPDTMRRPSQSVRPSASSYGPVDIGAIPLVFEEMTNYANTINNMTGDTPNFAVPSHPMVPPEYDQNVDYDSVQYMNGFLRTQIGRSVMVQQLIGSGNTVDRYGFLVGVGNNYLLLQDITNGNILLIDFYTVKYVYIYYSQPVYPSFRPVENR